MSTATAFQGEIMLAGWSETHNGGAKLIFWLPDAGELDAFRTLTVRKGNTAGQRFMAVLVQIGDDELPVPNPAPALSGKAPAATQFVAPKKTGPLCMLAVRFGDEAAFRTWATEHFGYEINTAAEVAEMIRTVCNVESRKDLDTSDFAAEAFHEQLRKPYVAWRNDRGFR